MSRISPQYYLWQFVARCFEFNVFKVLEGFFSQHETRNQQLHSLTDDFSRRGPPIAAKTLMNNAGLAFPCCGRSGVGRLFVLCH